MPPRLAHKKSRKGCQRCKARRVKCDERHPECANCSKQHVSCEYLPPSRPAPARSGSPLQPSTESGGVPLSASAAPRLPPPAGLAIPYSDAGEIEESFEPEERRMLELRLLHHFVTVVVHTFPACDEQRFRDLWTVETVRNAFEHSFLLNAILAISSLHLISDRRRVTYFYARDEDPGVTERVADALSAMAGNKTDFARAHRLYLNASFRQQRAAIANLGPSNADAVFMTSLLLSYQSMNLIPDRSSSSLYSPPVQWLRMTKAVYAIVEAASSMVRSDSLMTMMLAYTTEPDFKDRAAMFDPAFRQPFEALLDWAKLPEPDMDADTKHAYEETLAYVGGVYRALLNKEPPRFLVRRLVCLGLLAPVRYMELLEQKRPRALVILAHHFALSRAVEEHWWFHGAASRVVNGVRSILPAEWQWALDWPLSMIRVATPDQPPKPTVLPEQPCQLSAPAPLCAGETLDGIV